MEIASSGGPMMEQSIPEEMYPMVQIHIEAVLELLSVGSPHRVSLGRTACCGRGHTAAEEENDSERMPTRKRYGLTITSIPLCSLVDGCSRRWMGRKVDLVSFFFC